MCLSNTDERVERVPIVKLLRQSRRHMPWCPEARNAFVWHCVRHKLDSSTVTWRHLDKLLTEIHCDSDNLHFQVATRSRIQAALKGTLKKLLALDVIARNATTEDIEYPNYLVNSVVANTWDGDLDRLPRE
ncbi:hypothetical protein F5B21DRAFT_497446 [Xylaria acuta]|nr:hypothetical protein F5B21DRAFT_497446 [Xylaria acuta]